MTIAARALEFIQYILSGFGPKASTATAQTVKTELMTHVTSIDVGQIFQESADLFNGIITNGDYDGALRYFNCKGNVAFVARALDINKQAYCEIVTGLVSTPRGASIATDLRSQIV